MRELKQRGFVYDATHVDREWPFFIIEQWFCLNFWINRLLESKEISRYKFEASCHIIEKASFPADLRHSKNAFA